MTASADVLKTAQIRVRQLLPNTDRADTLDLQAQLAYSLGVLDAIKVIARLEDELAGRTAPTHA